MNVEPRYLAADMDNPPLQYEEEGIYGIARMERRMSHNPHHPRVFSLAYLMLPVFLPLTAGLTWGFISMLIDNSDFYDTHPQHLAQLNTLIGPPDHYDD
ncbi:hypothetical protein ACR746_01700 [Cutibacterium avidum]|uniref:hypothetical protein n=1 Tax=Cutibacterium avidum TaxID=33010 RepID=UPI003DA2771D